MSQEIKQLTTIRCQRIVRFFQLVSLCLITVYYALPVFNSKFQQTYLIKIVTPRIVYASIALAFILGQPKNDVQDPALTDLNEKKKEIKLFSTNGEICLIQLLLLVTGSNHILAFILHIITLAIINTFFLHFHSQSAIYPILMGLLSYFGYFSTGHTNGLTGLQISQGFIGFEEASVYIYGVLVSLNTVAAFILCFVAMSAYSKQIAAQFIESKTENEEILTLLSNKIFFKFATISTVFFVGGYIMTSIHILINYDAAYLTLEYAPKYMVDTPLYCFVIAVLFCAQMTKELFKNGDGEFPKPYNIL